MARPLECLSLGTAWAPDRLSPALEQRLVIGAVQPPQRLMVSWDHARFLPAAQKERLCVYPCILPSPE